MAACGREVHNNTKWLWNCTAQEKFRSMAFSIMLLFTLLCQAEMIVCWRGRNNHPWTASFPTPNDDFFSFLFSRMWKKQCKYCHFYSLCKLPEVMQAKFEFLSHHCSLYLAIHAQTFVYLEIYCWFSLIFIGKRIFLCRKWSVRGSWASFDWV